MKKCLIRMNLLALAAAVTFGLSACASREEPAAAAPDTPAAEAQTPERTASYSMLLGGGETTVYPETGGEEITLWDSASGGQIVAAARYARPMPGAADALRELDFTDLDGDGNSELSAGFSFPDGTSASLLWFYTDGGFVYSEEFSVQPGETPPAGAEP